MPVPEPPAARSGFPLGAGVSVAALADDPHPVLRQLREAEPVSWIPAVGGWLVSRADLAERVLRDPRAFTVDDPRFTTARVVGTSMLSLDGPEHRRHRDPFARALRGSPADSRLAQVAVRQAADLVEALTSHGTTAELRRGLAGPLAVAVMAEMLGLEAAQTQLLTWYDAIVAGVSALSSVQQGTESAAVTGAATRAFGELRAEIERALAGGRPSVLSAAAGELAPGEIVSNAAVLLFGGIETTEGMICNVIWHLLSDHGALAQIAASRGLLARAIEESLRLEPAAAVVDRYATDDVALGAAAIQRGDLVVVSLAGAGRDPAVFPDPDRFDLHRATGPQHLAFAVGPHFCIGAHIARLEARAAVAALLDRTRGLRLDPSRPSRPHGLVFKKPPSLHVIWDA